MYVLQGTPYKAQKKSSRKIYLLDLPEEVFRHVFQYLTEAEVYFTVRNVCRQLRTISDGYVQLGKFDKQFIL